MDVGCTQGVFGLSPIFLKSTPDLHRCDSVRADPYAHPQHNQDAETHCIHMFWIWDALQVGLEPQL